MMGALIDDDIALVQGLKVSSSPAAIYGRNIYEGAVGVGELIALLRKKESSSP
jgi:protein-disulfide isomerase